MKNFFFLLLLLITYSLNAQEDLPYPYNSLKEVLPFNPDGWYFNSAPMEQLLKERNVKVVIEVGSWLGASTRHIASVIPSDGVVYAVDHWLGSVEHSSLPEILPTLYEQFLSNVIHAELTDKIFPIRMSSLDAAQQFKENGIYPDLIYIDAAHDYNSVLADLKAYFPLVKGHGTLCGDDWLWKSVRRAITLFAISHRLKLTTSGNFWLLSE